VYRDIPESNRRSDARVSLTDEYYELMKIRNYETYDKYFENKLTCLYILTTTNNNTRSTALRPGLPG